MIIFLITAGTTMSIFCAGTFLLFLTTSVIVVPRTTGMTAIMFTLGVNTKTHRVATVAFFGLIVSFRLIVFAPFSVINREHGPFVYPPLPATKVGWRDRLALIGVAFRGEPCI